MRFTIILTISSDGYFLPPMINGRNVKKDRLFDLNKKFKHLVFFESQDHAWCDSKLFYRYVKYCISKMDRGL